jgi:beta-glucosidase
MTTLVPPYRDVGRSVAERAADLVARMSTAEKIAQLGAVWGFEVLDGDGVNVEILRGLVGDGIGHITRLAGSTNLRPAEVARAANAVQRFLVEETRLGIPAIIHEECLHGVMGFGATSFQQSIGAAATFDPALIAEVAGTIRRRMLATGARQGLGPVLDTTRDPRWGRVEETYGEDPYLAATLGAAYVSALQGDDLSAGVAATLKHLVGHGIAEGGLNQAPVHIGRRDLHDEQLLPFEAAVVESRAASVMPAYCEVDGLPCHASRELLTTILRDGWGFDGTVVSDYAGIEMLQTAHRLTDDRSRVAAMAIDAGVDVELPRRSIYDADLRQALESGDVSEVMLDVAVARVMELKIRLGLFEEPYVDELDPQILSDLDADERRVALELARRSMVLVANDGLLPLRSDLRRVALIGPGANSAREFVGDYSHLVHVETLINARQSGSTAFGVVDGGGNLSVEDELSGRSTVLSVLSERLIDADVLYAEGTGVLDGTDEAIAEAVALARDAEVAVVVLAERSGLTPDSTTGEFRDRMGLAPSGRQQELLEAIVATGTPVALVVVSGRPLALEWAASNCSAILLAWVPGDAGPAAIADVLAGACEPGGRLPITMPRHVGQVPLSYRHHPTGGRSNPTGAYVDGPAAPLWPFGYGLSYTSIEMSDLRLDQDMVPTVGGELTLSVDVRNTGARAGEEVVQLYWRDVDASVARPLVELIGFQRVALEPGERRTVVFSIHAEQFSFTDVDYRRVIEPGRINLYVGRSANDLPLRTSIEIAGQTVNLPFRSHFLTRSRIV